MKVMFALNITCAFTIEPFGDDDVTAMEVAPAPTDCTSAAEVLLAKFVSVVV